MRENRTYSSEGGDGERRSLPLSADGARRFATRAFGRLNSQLQFELKETP